MNPPLATTNGLALFSALRGNRAQFHSSVSAQAYHPYLRRESTTRNINKRYHEQPQTSKLSLFDDDQINSDIIFDDPNVDINDESIEHDKNANDSHDNKLEQLARNAYKEVEKQQILAKRVKQQNIELTKQLEQYKEQVRVFETTNMNKTNFHKEYIEADHWAKQLAIDLQNQFIQDRDKRRRKKYRKSEYVSELRSKLKKNENGGYENAATHSKVHVKVCDTEEILKDATKSQNKMENKLKDPIAIEKKQIFVQLIIRD
ncbi:hypothetical protein Tco_0798437 [Tanacetum coccineum]